MCVGNRLRRDRMLKSGVTTGGLFVVMVNVVYKKDYEGGCEARRHTHTHCHLLARRPLAILESAEHAFPGDCLSSGHYRCSEILQAFRHTRTHTHAHKSLA